MTFDLLAAADRVRDAVLSDPALAIGARFEIVSDGPVAIGVLGRGPHCSSCPRCGAVTSMYGHSSTDACHRAWVENRHDSAFVAAHGGRSPYAAVEEVLDDG